MIVMVLFSSLSVPKTTPFILSVTLGPPYYKVLYNSFVNGNLEKQKTFENYEKRMCKEGPKIWCSKFDPLHEY